MQACILLLGHLCRSNRLLYLRAQSEINVQFEGADVASGGTADFLAASTVTKTFTIQNTGDMTLNLTGGPPLVSVTGTAYVVSTQPGAGTIAASSSLTFEVTYTASSVGAMDSETLTIQNDDADEGMYTVNLTGLGIYETTDGERGNMFVGDGTDDKVDVGDVTILSFERTNAFTLECWFKTNSTANSFITKIQTIGAGTGYSLGMVGGAIDLSLVNDATTNILSVSTTTTFDDNAWHHVAAVYDGSSGSSGVDIYVDGVGQGLNTVSNTLSTSIDNTESVFLGAFLTGNLEEVRIWGMVRTQDQIRENMHLTLSGSETGLLAYYQLNGTSGAVVDKVNGNNGTLIDNGTRSASDLAMASGVSTRQTISASGDVTLGNIVAGFTSITAPGAGDEFVTYQLYDTPYNNIIADGTINTSTSDYWIIRQFGTQTFEIDQLTFTIPNWNIISATDEATPANLKLYKRNSNTTDITWGGASFADAQSASNTTKEIVFGNASGMTGELNMTSFSELVVASSGDSPLPVTLIDFKATRRKDRVMLAWTTTTEKDNLGFEIEMSTDGKKFENIGFMENAQSSETIRQYNFALENTKPGYYRLKQLDNNRRFAYSNIQFVPAFAGDISLNTYPNPVQCRVHLDLGEQWDKEGQLYLYLFTPQGKPVFRQKGSLTELNRGLNQQLSFIQKGWYVLELRTKNQRFVRRLVVE